MALSVKSLSRHSSQDLSSQVIEEIVSKPNGDASIKRYTKGRFLGKGGFARVYEFTQIENRQVSAAKIIPKSALSKARAKQKLMSEIRIHRALHHTNVVSFEHFFEDSENVYMLLELCNNQTLSDLLRRRKRLTELEVVNYTVQTAAGLKYLHEHKIIHRDIKLGNLFLTERMELKIGDFGLATKLEFDGERKRTICGTPNYIAPEVLEGKQGHSYEVDIWSLGVVIYTLLIGKPPFETSDVKSTYKKIKQNSYSFPDHIPLSNEARGLISRILLSEPSKRPSLDEILTHEFFTKFRTIPKLLPPSTLAIPPSRTYFEEHRGTVSSQEDRTGRSHGTTERLLRSTSQPALVAESEIKPEEDSMPDLWVTKWVDYSSKYGLGYTLSNGLLGVYFNDSSKLVIDPRSSTFGYAERGSEGPCEYFTLNSYPVSLNKKVTLLQHFKSYLEVPNTSRSAPVPQPYHYVKKWVMTEHAMVFRLSTKSVQVCFLDKTELVLSSESKIVMYLDKQGVRKTHSLASAMASGTPELTKRLKYTKEVLGKMLQGKMTAGAVTERHRN